MNCKICSHETTYWGTAKILARHDVAYYRCLECGFVQTESPYWLNEAYSTAITKSDLGLVQRNLAMARITQSMILACFNCNAKFIDYGGGYGLFVRLMRDRGLDFYRFDKFCANLFSENFDAAEPTTVQYELLTAFEVFEHLTDPLAEIEQMLKFSTSIFFSTILLPPSNPKLGEWWYYGIEHGQHISLYTPKALKIIANKFRLHLYSHKNGLHLLTPQTISPIWFTIATRLHLAPLLRLIFMRKLQSPSLLETDYFKVTGTWIH